MKHTLRLCAEAEQALTLCLKQARSQKEKDQMKNEVNIQCRILIRQGNAHGLGLGTVALLERVHALGSLRKAAASIETPYRSAWGRIRRAEKALGIRLLQGGSERQQGLFLTEEGRRIIAVYTRLNEKCQEALSSELKILQDLAGINGQMAANQTEKTAQAQNDAVH